MNEVANMALAEEQMTELRSKVALQMGVIGGEPNQPVDALLQVSSEQEQGNFPSIGAPTDNTHKRRRPQL